VRARILALLLIAANAIHASPAAAAATRCVTYQFNSVRDHGRSFSADGQLRAWRPVHYGLWTPATACDGPRMTFGDYAADAAVQRGLAASAVHDAAFWRELVSSASVLDDAVLGSATPAVRSAPTLPASADVVLYIHASALEAHALAESLAVSGTVVAALTWRGTYQQDFDVGASGLVSEVLDVQAVLRDLGTRGLAINRIVAIGTSFGALTALCWHGAEPRVAAIVSLDGGIATPTAARLLPSCPWSKPPTPVVLLHLYDASYAGVTFDYLRSRSEVTLVAEPIPLLQHRDYHSTVFVRANAAGTTDGAERTSIARSLIVRVRDFVRCTFAGRAAACLDDAAPQAPQPQTE
jgi:dienelactone hydrolase